MQLLLIPAPSPGQAQSIFASINCLIVNISCKWNYTLCGVSWLAPFICSVFRVEPYCSTYQYFVPYYSWIISPLMGIPHFIYPFILWWTFGLFLLFDCYEKSAVNVHIQVFAPMFLFLLNRYLWVEWLGQLVNLCLTSKETTIFQSACAVFHLISVSISPTLVIVIIVYLYFMPSFFSILFCSLR